MKWAITEKFHDYLYGNTFIVRTDNNQLTYVSSSAKLDATGHRWLAALGNYNFKAVYKPGRQNSDADGLSRRPHVQQDEILCLMMSFKPCVQKPGPELMNIPWHMDLRV